MANFQTLRDLYRSQTSVPRIAFAASSAIRGPSSPTQTLSKERPAAFAGPSTTATTTSGTWRVRDLSCDDKESLGQLWDYHSPAWARKFFDQWCDALRWQRLEPLRKFARMIEANWDGIEAFCRRENKVPLGFVEEFNNKIRVIQRRAYGIRNEENLRLKALACTLPKLWKSPTKNPEEPNKHSRIFIGGEPFTQRTHRP
jgi:hypothetical protein